MQQFNNIDEYIKIVCQQIRCKKIHKDISLEITNHINDQKEAFILQGLDGQTATIKAIEEMGDPVNVGFELDRTHRPKPEWSIIGLTILALIIGLVIQFFMSDRFETQFIASLIGIVLLVIIYFIDYTIIGKIGKYPKSICFIFFVLYIINSVMSKGSKVYLSADLYLYVPILYVPIYAGILYSLRGQKYKGILLSGLYFLFPMFISLMNGGVIAVLLQITICCLIVLTFAIMKDWFDCKRIKSLLLVYIPTIIVSILIVFKSQYRIGRILAWLNPEFDPYGSGYQINIIRTYISNSKFIGTTTTNGGIIEGYIPSINTDCILTYLIAKFGFAVGILIIVIFAILIIRMFIVSLKQTNSLGFIISLSGTLIIAIQGIFYITFNLGIGLFSPTILPFISYGGIGLIVNMCIMGLILSVFSETPHA